tara:strand:- start:4439 stop:4903 length:465 start_codon:yes stop_codon:yes gene_type:complete
VSNNWSIREGRYYYEDAIVGISHVNVDSNLTGLNYTTSCVFVDSVTLPKPPTKTKTDWAKPLRCKLSLTTQQFCKLLSRYNEQGFNDMPKWLKDQFLMRTTYLKPRPPTELEQWETVSDALEHRIVHKELTIDDYHTRFVKGKQLSTHGVFNNV